jgi:hypothetical protein
MSNMLRRTCEAAAARTIIKGFAPPQVLARNSSALTICPCAAASQVHVYTKATLRLEPFFEASEPKSGFDRVCTGQQQFHNRNPGCESFSLKQKNA